MYIDTSQSKQHGKVYTRYLLRENYREDGKVKHHTVANLSHCSELEIAAIKLALKHKHDLNALSTNEIKFKNTQGLSVGADWLLYDLAKQLGIVNALGNTKNGKLALLQVISRIIGQGSRLSAVRLASRHALSDILGLEGFDEDNLYANLDWLSEEQEKIEDRLFKQLGSENVRLFLYDVTSSYLEGECNELAAYGYNRDGKKGKLQIVIGLLCNQEGVPLSIQVFTGNTSDMKTLSSQIEKAARRFGAKKVTFVGDRGMIKSAEVKDLKEQGFYHITAITKAQINTMLDNGMIQLGLFDEMVHEVIDENGERFILRCNPVRAEELEQSRQSKLQSLQKLVTTKNEYLRTHKRAKTKIALREVTNKAKQLKITDWLIITAIEREITVKIDEQKLQQAKELDGCYVIKTDLPEADASKEIIHERYKDLALVEWAFRTSKTAFLELRPIYVRLASRTRGHALVVMLAYRIIKELSQKWRELDITVEEGIKNLATLCTMEVQVNERTYYNQIPKPNDLLQQLFAKANVILPEVLPKINSEKAKVATKKKLPTERKII